ncbi:hypothetical protein ACFX13_032737 [Malus domestica]
MVTTPRLGLEQRDDAGLREGGRAELVAGEVGGEAVAGEGREEAGGKGGSGRGMRRHQMGRVVFRARGVVAVANMCGARSWKLWLAPPLMSFERWLTGERSIQMEGDIETK